FLTLFLFVNSPSFSLQLLFFLVKRFPFFLSRKSLFLCLKSGLYFGSKFSPKTVKFLAQI
ncbi:hypothetical protein, partial [Mycoplasmoides pneumoniae]